MILSGRIAAGRRLVEQEIAGSLAVSRTPVRDALRRLESDGILQALPKGGLVVREYGDAEVEELYRIRAALESLAAEYAARNATPEELEQLERHLHDLQTYPDDSPEDVHKIAELHREFTALYCRSCHLPHLLRLLEPLLEQIALVRTLGMAAYGRRASTAEEHREIFAALKARQPERAAGLAQAHVLKAYQAYSTRRQCPGKG
jgi:DNA-binding GntR family transcriptional regulator